MAVDFFFYPPTIDIPSAQSLRTGLWANCPQVIRKHVVHEYQYFIFQLEALDRVKFTQAGALPDKPWVMALDWTTRAGAVKAAILVGASILEAVLRAIAEHRNYTLPPDPRRRTFGKVLGAWESPPETPRPEVEDIWPTLQKILDVRNNVHLFAAATNPQANYQALLDQEQQLLADTQTAINHVAAITP